MKVLFLDTVHPVLEQRLTKSGMECIDGTSSSLDSLFSLGATVEGLVVRSRFNLDEKFLRHFPVLKFIARAGAGMETIDEVYCQERKIQLFNAPEGNRTAVAEHALGMLLSLFNKLSKGDKEVREGTWEREGNRGLEIAGKTVGVIGFGNNGSEFAKILSGFDCKILAYDKYRSNFGTEHIQEVALETIFEQADIVSFHIPQTEESIFMGNTAFFSRFQKPIYLINLSRGKIVSLEAVWEGIEQQKIKGACLDVLELENKSFEQAFNEKKLPFYLENLLQSDKVLFSPHVGGWTVESYYKLSAVLVDKILASF